MLVFGKGGGGTDLHAELAQELVVLALQVALEGHKGLEEAGALRVADAAHLASPGLQAGQLSCTNGTGSLPEEWGSERGVVAVDGWDTWPQETR